MHTGSKYNLVMNTVINTLMYINIIQNYATVVN